MGENKRDERGRFTCVHTFVKSRYILIDMDFFSFIKFYEQSPPKLLKECLMEYQQNNRILKEIHINCFNAFL